MPKASKKTYKGMHPHDIHAALKKRGQNFSQIARDLNITNSSVRQIVFGMQQSKRVAEHIAQLLGKSVHDLWPGEYDYQSRPPLHDTLKKNRSVA